MPTARLAELLDFARWRELDIYSRFCFGAVLLITLSSNVSTAAANIGLGLGALVLIVEGVRRKKIPDFDRVIFALVVIHTAVWIVVSLAGFDPMHSLRELWGTTYRFIPLFLAMLVIKEPWQMRLVIASFAVSVGVDLIMAGWQMLTPEGRHWGIRPTGFNKSATFLASHMLMAIPFLFFAAQRNYLSQKLRRFCLGVGAAAIFFLFATQTRGAWLALGIVWIFFALSEKHLRRRLLQAFAFVLVVFFLVVNFCPSIQNRVATLTDPKFQSNSERLLMWQSSVDIFSDYPVTGIGQDEFAVLYNTIYISPLAKELPKDPSDPRTGHTHPHNNLLKILSEGGILGMVAFLLLHGYMVYRSWQLWREEKRVGEKFPWGLAGILMIMGIHLEGLTDTNITQVSIMREYWLLLGVIFAAAPPEIKRAGNLSNGGN